MNKCKFCEREINNKGSLKSHENRCKENPDRVIYPHSPKAGAKKGSKLKTGMKNGGKITAKARRDAVWKAIEDGTWKVYKNLSTLKIYLLEKQ